MLIIGAGSIGTLILYSLYKSGVDVDLLVKDYNVLKRIVDNGCKIMFKGVEKLFHPPVYTWESIDDDYDIVFICVKAYDVPLVVEHIKSRLSSPSMVISIQNGIGSFELLEEVFGVDRSGVAVVSYGAYKTDVCNSVVTGYGDIILGTHGGNPDILVKLANILRKAGLNSEYESNIDGYRWLKTLVNAGINPVTAIFNAENRIIVENKWAHKLAEMAVEEGVEVVKALEVNLPMDPLDALVDVVMKTADNISSMLQDIRHGRETEIDYINGAIVKYGERLKIDTPVNRFLVLAVRGLSEWRRSR